LFEDLSFPADSFVEIQHAFAQAELTCVETSCVTPEEAVRAEPGFLLQQVVKFNLDGK
jgi:hypothetical protein